MPSVREYYSKADVRSGLPIWNGGKDLPCRSPLCVLVIHFFFFLVTADGMDELWTQGSLLSGL